MQTENVPNLFDDDHQHVQSMDPNGAQSSPVNGGGNGVDSSKLGVLYFDVTTESSANASISYLTSGQKWGTEAIGKAANVTYSVCTADSAFSYSGATPSGKTALEAAQITGAQKAMALYADVCGLSFTQTTDSASNAGDIRWSNTTNTGVGTAYAYYPSTSASGGDIWLGPNYSAYKNPVVNAYGFHTYLHELGHAVGMNHPHESEITPKAQEDQMKYTVMSYRSYDGMPTNAGYSNSFYPSTLMLNDIAAMQFLYGANMSTRTGDNTYSWAADAKVFETIWDAGGTDTISAATQAQACKIYLTAGKWSEIGVSFSNGQTKVRDCLTIAYGATIENATGSAYADTLEGNAVANTLVGGAGNDTISALEGNDVLNGGVGNDMMDGGAGTDTANFVDYLVDYGFTVTDGVISITDKYLTDGNEGTDSLSNIEILHFGDRDVSILSTLDTLRYIASSPDLVKSCGTSTDAGLAHYLNFSVKEGRPLTFDATVYINKYAEVRAAVGSDQVAATKHYISTGFALGWSDSLSSNDILNGTKGNDTINAYGGNDKITGSLGNDIIDGGTGTDTVNYVDYLADYSFSVTSGVITITDKYLADGNEGVDTLSNVEILHFGDRDMDVSTLNTLRYVASNGDLIGALGTNTDAALKHYLTLSVKEGRSVTFDPTVYLNKYADVRAASGSDLEAATRHFITTGVKTGRSDSTTSNDNLSGTNGNDTINAYGGNDTIRGAYGNDLIDGGSGTDVANYVDYLADYGFSVNSGVITITDRYLADGNEGVDALSNIEVLHFGDRDMNVTTLTSLRYIASNGDLIGKFGTNTDAGLAHYLNYSVKEARPLTFDPSVYLNKYADVRATAGSDLEAATRHFITTGSKAGRSDSTTSNDNLLGTSGNDTINAYGGNDTIRGALGNDLIDGGSGTDTANYIDYVLDYGFSVNNGVITITDRYLQDGNEGVDTLSNIEILHFGDRDMNVTTLNALRYVASYGDLINAIGSNTNAGLAHYLNYSVREGRGVSFDPNIYLAKYADVRTAYGTDHEAATLHFVTTGFGLGRNLNLNGNDTLTGSSSADTLDGGAGNDTISGAGGADIFKFGAASGADVISDFSIAQGDKIYIANNVNASGITSAALALSHASGASNAVIDLGNGHTITLTGVAAGSLSAADFVIY